ncbi:T9SS type A sorting domain-containing protein [Hyunsoonleella sp. SJ7]|uniref:T9SS type A sorting domain-containing protein n=1 Tax=Hyunsoonleella aquatilis TaxID=2762758 RepID=A0A923HD25_9FLAO|nr:T9SS type A sorting domain-containing protein [Hyunsoonleella aquatilis]MBC3758921.1 T9SS type A sorting domain-containing protein [Hyunsoonleella aquatilis]
MKKTTLKYTIVCLTLILGLSLFSQTVPCDGTVPFEEQNGLLTIEMESGILPANSDWKEESEPDPNLPGSTINYIYWDGADSFSALPGAAITYNIKINNTGTYRFFWRGRIGAGNSGGEHNDAWLKIVADDFYATKQSSHTATGALEPKPDCNSNPDRTCPAGSSVGGFFKAFMNRHPGGNIEDRWGFVTNTNDHDSFRFIWATFNTPGNYSVIVDARSNSFFIDKMVLYRTDVSKNTAEDLNNSESTCTTLSVDDISKVWDVKIYPNPSAEYVTISNLPNNGTLLLKNIHGVTVKRMDYKSSNTTLDLTALQSGVYFISNLDRGNYFVKKLIKI